MSDEKVDERRKGRRWYGIGLTEKSRGREIEEWMRGREAHESTTVRRWQSMGAAGRVQ